MATLVLTVVGAVVGGPVGASVGALVGNQIDRALFAPQGRTGPRLDDLTVQSSAYGAPHPLLFGIIRAAGNIIWSSGLKETAHRSGGGKQSGGRTTSFSYSASFTVVVAARPIERIGRIWGDGKLLRGASGELTAAGAIRIHTGDERQLPDPLIVAVEGVGNVPAHRGLAYVVFEDLELGDFANRIPNLSFEVIADLSAPSVGTIAEALCSAAGVPAIVEGLAVSVPGFAAARNAPLSTWLASLSLLETIRLGESGHAPRLFGAGIASGITLNLRQIAASREVRSSETRTAAVKAPNAVTIGYLDPDRDFQAGLQRAFRPSGAPNEEHFELPAVLSAGAAKNIAEDMLQRRWTGRQSGERRMLYAALGIEPGDRIQTEDGREWDVRGTTIEGMIVHFDLSPVALARGEPVKADGGRANTEADLPQGDTHLHVFELPPLGGETPAMPRLWIAAGGTGEGWRRAELWLSRDAGATWSSFGLASGIVPMGAALNVLADADATRWDEGGFVDVEMLSEAMWLDGRSALSVLAGANVALLGDEIIQFRSAEGLSPRRFRLRGLLRGRRATEAATGGHVAGERFVMLTADVFALDQPADSIGTAIEIRAAAPNTAFIDSPMVSHRISGRALKPLAPVHLRARRQANGDIEIRWFRRSRTGFGWIDGADAPLGEDGESYRLCCVSGDAAIEVVIAEPVFVLSAARQLTEFGAIADSVSIELAQMSSAVGQGEILTATFSF